MKKKNGKNSIKKLRNNHNFTIEELGYLIGSDGPNVVKISHGKIVPCLEKAFKLRHILDSDLKEIFHLTYQQSRDEINARIGLDLKEFNNLSEKEKKRLLKTKMKEYRVEKWKQQRQDS